MGFMDDIKNAASQLQQSSEISASQAGWYPDTQNPGKLRYWDGQQWTNDTKDETPLNTEPAPVMPAATQAAPAPNPTAAAAPSASANNWPIMEYVVMQVTLKEKLVGTGSGNLSSLESVINKQAQQGYHLHTVTTASAQSGGLMGGDRIQATLVFERPKQ
ncbi:MAG: DUF2510 domain-containing protein [Coriobacteriia bacterium]|nr:DUF2510 domain-containing protein [Coriobacteriia bacterium]